MTIEVGKGSYIRPLGMRDGRNNGRYAGTPLARIEGEDVDGIEYPVAPGESLYAAFQIDFRGDSEQNVSIVIKTPPNPNGGFFLTGATQHPNRTSDDGPFPAFPGTAYDPARGYESTYIYGADKFNEPVGVWRCGTPNGEDGGWNSARGRIHLANSDHAGLVKIQVSRAWLMDFQAILLSSHLLFGSVASFQSTQGSGDTLVAGTEINAVPALSRLGHPQQVTPDRVVLVSVQSFDGGPAPAAMTLSGGSYAWATHINTTQGDSRLTVFSAPPPADDPKYAAVFTGTFPSYPNLTSDVVLECYMHGVSDVVAVGTVQQGSGNAVSVPFVEPTNRRNMIMVCLVLVMDDDPGTHTVTPPFASGNMLTGSDISNFGPATLSQTWERGQTTLTRAENIYVLTSAARADQITSPLAFSWAGAALPYFAFAIEFANKYVS